jgi:hypothetical protein
VGEVLLEAHPKASMEELMMPSRAAVEEVEKTWLCS